MKFSLAKEQRDFFEQKGLLEVEGLITPSQLEILNSCVAEFVKKEAASQRRTVASVDPQKYFLAGHDLGRENPEIKKVIYHKSFSEVALELNFRAPFRMGYNQYIPQKFNSNENFSLNDISSFQGLLFGYILCLKAENLESIEDSADSDSSESPFSTVPGHVVFLHPDFPIDYSLLKHRQGCEYILVTYIKDKSVYCFQEKNVQTHFLKKLGYGFGDRIKEETHPIVYRA